MCEYSLCLSSELLRDVFSSLFSFFISLFLDIGYFKIKCVWDERSEYL